MRERRVWKWGIPLLLAIAFFLGGWTLRTKLAADRQGQWIQPTRGDLISGIDVTGTLAALDDDSFGPPQLYDVWEFKIAMMAPEGSEVKKGQPVLGFDTTELQHRLEQYSAESAQARKEIERKQADLALRREDERLLLAEADARMRKTKMKLEAPSDLTGVKERKEVELDYTLAVSETAAIRRRIDALERAGGSEIRLLQSKQQHADTVVATTRSGIAQMTILAPREGTVVYVQGPRGDGEKKKIGDSCWRAEKVLQVPDLTRMRANGDVDEVDAGSVAVGQRVSFRLDARPDEEFRGTIVTAGRTVQQPAGTKNPLKVLKVEIRLDRTDPVTMRPGMRFHGTVELSRKRNALLIPRSAVFLAGSGPVAYRRTLFSVTAVPLRLGRESASDVEVIGGIAPGDRILVAAGDGDAKAKS
jgi:hypothetical protein